MRKNKKISSIKAGTLSKLFTRNSGAWYLVDTQTYLLNELMTNFRMLMKFKFNGSVMTTKGNKILLHENEKTSSKLYSSKTLTFLDWVVCFFDIELQELLVYFGD